MNEGIVENLRRAADKWEKNHPIIGTGELRVHDALRDAARCIEDTSAKIPAWIDVEERLPEKEGDYLVHKVHSYNDHDGYSQIAVCTYLRMRDPEWLGCGNLCKVTHWMPLPTEPNLHVS